MDLVDVCCGQRLHVEVLNSEAAPDGLEVDVGHVRAHEDVDWLLDGYLVLVESLNVGLQLVHYFDARLERHLEVEQHHVDGSDWQALGAALEGV